MGTGGFQGGGPLSAQILDGKALSQLIRTELKQRVAKLKKKGVQPKLAVLVASQDPASLAYVRMKQRLAEEIGVLSETFQITVETSQEELLSRIQRLNADPDVHGVLVQHPLPSHLDENEALSRLGPEKDVDGITPQSLGRLLCDLPGFRCATPLGIMRLLERYHVPLEGKNALVIGRSVILGKPAALMLLQKNATVTIAHSKTQELPELCREADILIAAVGRPEMVKGDWIKEGAVVIDAGYNKVAGRGHDVGDCQFESCAARASWITPVPGGVGPMTVVSLLSNVVEAAQSTTNG